MPQVLVTLRRRPANSRGSGADRVAGWWLHDALVAAIVDGGLLPAAIAAPADHGADACSLLAERYVSCAMGLILGGGEDIQWRPGMQAVGRDAFELALLKAAIAASIPVLGICRGAQLIHLYVGGELARDPSGGHSSPACYPHHGHAVSLWAHTTMNPSDTVQSLWVNSAHAWQLRAPSGRQRVLASADDASIEAFELTDAPSVRGVMWHPEFADSHFARWPLAIFLGRAGTNCSV